MKTTSRFEKFLINRNLLEKFKNNLGKYYSYYPDIDSLTRAEFKREYITGSFEWRSSPEGINFWIVVHYEWELSLDENTL